MLTLSLVVLSAFTVSAQVSPSRCADCHFANPDAPGRRHLTDWDLSAHGRGHVGCETCHGGNATTFDTMPAHRGILRAADAASPVNRNNLPVTCGRCHAGPFVAFQRSRHYELLKTANPKGPTCSTCHGEVAAQLLSPKGIEGECNQCHGPGKTTPRPDRAAQARRLLEQVRDVRAQLSAAKRLIDDVRDTARRRRLLDAYEQAEVPLIEAVNAGHAFVFTESEERLDVARRRTAALYRSIVVAPVR